MTPLDLVLAIKVGGTALMVAAPLLLLPTTRLTRRMNVDHNAEPLLRLYGVSVLALLVGYCFGFSKISNGMFPWNVVTVGLVSNGGAVLALLPTGAHTRLRGMTWFLGCITIGLAAAALRPDLAIKPL